MRSLNFAFLIVLTILNGIILFFISPVSGMIKLMMLQTFGHSQHLSPSALPLMWMALMIFFANLTMTILGWYHAGKGHLRRALILVGAPLAVEVVAYLVMVAIHRLA